MTITRQGTRLEQIIRERSNLPGLIIIPADASDDFGGLSFAFYRLSLPGLMIPSESLHLFKKETQFLCTFSKHLWLAVGTASLAAQLSAARQSENLGLSLLRNVTKESCALKSISIQETFK